MSSYRIHTTSPFRFRSVKWKSSQTPLNICKNTTAQGFHNLSTVLYMEPYYQSATLLPQCGNYILFYFSLFTSLYTLPCCFFFMTAKHTLFKISILITAFELKPPLSSPFSYTSACRITTILHLLQARIVHHNSIVQDVSFLTPTYPVTDFVIL